MAKESIEMTPRVFITDGLQAYRDAFKKEYDAVKKGSPIHIRISHSKEIETTTRWRD